MHIGVFPFEAPDWNAQSSKTPRAKGDDRDHVKGAGRGLGICPAVVSRDREHRRRPLLISRFLFVRLRESHHGHFLPLPCLTDKEGARESEKAEGARWGDEGRGS